MFTTLAQVIGEKQADKIIEWAVQNPITLFLLVIGLIAVVALAAWALLYIPAKMKERKQNREQLRLDRIQKREDLKAEQAHELAKLALIRDAEIAKATQASAMQHSVTVLADIITEAKAVLTLGKATLDRHCPGGQMPRTQGGSPA